MILAFNVVIVYKYTTGFQEAQVWQFREATCSGISQIAPKLVMQQMIPMNRLLTV